MSTRRALQAYLTFLSVLAVLTTLGHCSMTEDAGAQERDDTSCPVQCREMYREEADAIRTEFKEQMKELKKEISKEINQKIESSSDAKSPPDSENLSDSEECLLTESESSGLLVTGGYGASETMEAWDAISGKVCRGPDLPDRRYQHTADLINGSLVICGGENTRTNCTYLTAELTSWSWSNQTSNQIWLQNRTSHVSWVNKSGHLYLIGGWNWNRDAVFNTTEIVARECVNGTQCGWECTERDEPNPPEPDWVYSVGPGFSVERHLPAEYPGSGACAIPGETNVIITGGTGGSSNNVEEYSWHGFVRSLPSLQQPRFHHACGMVEEVNMNNPNQKIAETTTIPVY